MALCTRTGLPWLAVGGKLCGYSVSKVLGPQTWRSAPQRLLSLRLQSLLLACDRGVDRLQMVAQFEAWIATLAAISSVDLNVELEVASVGRDQQEASA